MHHRDSLQQHGSELLSLALHQIETWVVSSDNVGFALDAMDNLVGPRAREQGQGHVHHAARQARTEPWIRHHHD